MSKNFWCSVGFHGPTGVEDRTHKSMYIAPFQRMCGDCGAVWHGGEEVFQNVRHVGNWEQVEKGQKNFNLQAWRTAEADKERASLEAKRAIENASSP